MRVLQQFSMPRPDRGDVLSVTISRFPNGGGVIERVTRIWWDEDGERRDDETMLSRELSQQIEHVAAEFWDAYWTDDPRTARGWMDWKARTEKQIPVASQEDAHR